MGFNRKNTWHMLWPHKKLHKPTLSHEKRGFFYKQNKPKLMRFWDTKTSFKVFNVHTIHINAHMPVDKNQICLNTMTLIQYHIWKFAFHISSFAKKKSHNRLLSYKETIQRQLISSLSEINVQTINFRKRTLESCPQTQILPSWLYGKAEN